MIGAASLSLVCGSATADTLNFKGTAAATCSLTSPTDGAITLGGDLQSWATSTAASIHATNTAPATVIVTRPSAWSTSPANTPSTTFAHSATFSGSNLGSLTGNGDVRSGPLTALGNTTVSVSLSATASNPYPHGDYVAQVTVTCTVP